MRSQLQRTMERYEIDLVTTADERKLWQNIRKTLVCGFFMQVILGDYVGAILGLVRDGLDWRLDPLAVGTF